MRSSDVSPMLLDVFLWRLEVSNFNSVHRTWLVKGGNGEEGCNTKHNLLKIYKVYFSPVFHCGK